MKKTAIFVAAALAVAVAMPFSAQVRADEFPDTSLVDDFNRPADEADNSGGQNTQGLDTWWYNAYDYVIEDGALVVTFDGDAHQHFGMGANVPAEAEYPYLVLRVHGVPDGDYSGLSLNLGAKNPVLFSDMVTPDGIKLQQVGLLWTTLAIDMAASGVVFDQGFHLNSTTVGTLYIDEIYYTSVKPKSALLRQEPGTEPAVTEPAPVEGVGETTGGETTPVLISADIRPIPATAGTNGWTFVIAVASLIAASASLTIRAKLKKAL